MTIIKTYASKIIEESDLVPDSDGSYFYKDGTFCIKKIDNLNGISVDFNRFMIDGVFHQYLNRNAVVNPGQFYYDTDGDLHICIGHKPTKIVNDQEVPAVVGLELRLLKIGDLSLDSGYIRITRYFPSEFIIKDSDGSIVMPIISDGYGPYKLDYATTNTTTLVKYGFATIVISDESGGGGSIEELTSRVNTIESDYLDTKS